METARTILQQLGGNKFIAMVGANNLTGDNNSLTFKFKMCRKANCCKITLNALDLYDIEFMKINFKKYEVKGVDSFENVYNDQLTGIFENVTGLRTSLF